MAVEIKQKTEQLLKDLTDQQKAYLKLVRTIISPTLRLRDLLSSVVEIGDLQIILDRAPEFLNIEPHSGTGVSQKANARYSSLLGKSFELVSLRAIQASRGDLGIIVPRNEAIEVFRSMHLKRNPVITEGEFGDLGLDFEDKPGVRRTLSLPDAIAIAVIGGHPTIPYIIESTLQLRPDYFKAKIKKFRRAITYQSPIFTKTRCAFVVPQIEERSNQALALKNLERRNKDIKIIELPFTSQQFESRFAETMMAEYRT